MAAEQQPQENEDLTMEEILQSIRKIISDDDVPEDQASESTAGDEENDMAEEETIEAEGSEVLELTDEFEEEAPAEEPSAEEEPAQEEPAEAVDVLQEIDDALDVEEPAAEEPVEEAPTAVEAPAEAMAEPAVDADSLLSTPVAAASAASLKKVVETHKATTPVPHMRNGVTVEDLVLESIKPMLKDWLDENLPSMVERIVEREIRKLVD